MNIEELGITKEELTNRLVDKLADELLTTRFSEDNDGEDGPRPSPFAEKLRELIKDRINAKVAEIAERRVLPLLNQRIDDLVMQETNQWGEKKGSAIPFVEYVALRAEAYLNEEVDTNGRTCAECRHQGTGFYGRGNKRISYLVNDHLHREIDCAMKESVKLAQAGLTDALVLCARHKLAEIADKLKVEVRTQ